MSTHKQHHHRHSAAGRARLSTLLLSTLLLAAFVNCGGGTIPMEGTKRQTTLRGVVWKGPVKASTVVVYRVDATLQRGEALSGATTGDDGTFEVKLPPYTGPAVVVASGGTYREEAVPLDVDLSNNELVTFLPALESGSTVEGLRLTPVSTWAAALTAFHVGKGDSPAAAWEEAQTNLDAHLGTLKWAVVAPADTTKTTALNQEGRAGLLLAALSAEAKALAQASNLSPGLAVNAASLTTALAQDLLADGTWNGFGPSGQLRLGTQVLTGQSMRLAYSQALTAFVTSSANGTGLREADVRALATSLATSTNPYLFCEGQDASRCTANGTDIDAPVVAFVSPLDASPARGSIDVEVTATDATAVSSLQFLEPAVLVPTQMMPSLDGKSASLHTMFDVSALPDGNVVLAVRAQDSLGNATMKSITIRVSNHGPRLTVTSPSANSTVSGIVNIAASAQAESGVVSRIEVLGAPAGLGQDALPDAVSFAATWDTRQMPEGPYQLKVRATDSNGGLGEVTVDVVVDNVAFGVVTASVTAGAPIAGATVKLLAIDAMTGMPVTNRPSAVLGQSTSVTDGDGGISFTLSQENYSGPVQLVAEGTSLSVEDVSDVVVDGGTALRVTMPGSFRLTSYVGQYRTGDRLDGVLTLYTTIADSAARAYSQARNPTVAMPIALPTALATTDALFSGHISRPQQWSLRSVRPASLVNGRPQTLRDAVFAAFPDVGLHQLARDLSIEGGLTPGATVTAFTLAELLVSDVDDGLFDGRAGMTQLTVPGMPVAYSLDAHTSRFKLAGAIDRFLRGPRNNTSLQRADVQAAGVFDSICASAPPQNPFYPSTTPPLPFDSQPPVVTVTVTFTNGALTDATPVHVGTADVFGGTVTLLATATDDSGMRSTEVRLANNLLSPLPGNSAGRYGGTYVPASSGPLMFVIRACDSLGNCGITNVPLTADIVAPAITVTAPTALQRVRLTAPVDVSAADSAGIASFVFTGFSGFTDMAPALERIQGAWSVPMSQPEGAVTASLRACDVVGNCATASPSVFVDKTPPATTVIVTWGPSNKSPVGMARVVADTVHVSAASTDPAGVASATLLEGNTTVASVNGAASTSVWGNFNGAPLSRQLAFIARTCDSLGNCGDTTSLVLLDNTRPTIEVNLPDNNSYYSTSMPVAARGIDASGLREAMTVTGLSGFGDSDSAFDNLTGTWTVPPGTPDGTHNAVFTACDVVDNCATATYPFVTDNTPPEVTVASPPPRYTRAAFLFAAELGVSVSDMGDANAYVSVTTPAGDETQYNAGTATLLLGGEGDYIIRVYGIDAAVPTHNSGRTKMPGPYLAVYTVTVDRSAPAPSVVAPIGVSYFSEVGLTVAVDASGAPQRPVQWQYTGTQVALNVPGTQIFKASSRLSWGSAKPTPSELEGSNYENVPWLQLQVPNGAAPTTAGRYRFVVTDCRDCTSPITTAWTPLDVASRSASGAAQYFNLLIAQETLPQLLAPTTFGSVAYVIFRVEVEVSDAANNVGTWTSDDRRYNLVAAPIAVARDLAYSARNDAKSIYAYRRANGTYPALYDVNNLNFSGDPFVRVSRSVVYNPSNTPVVFQPARDAAATPVLTSETWSTESYDLPGTYDAFAGSPTFTWGSSTFKQFYEWDSRPGSTIGSHCTNPGRFTFPCGGTGQLNFQLPRSILGSAFQCISTASVPSAASTLFQPVNDRTYRYAAFKNPVVAPTGVESTPADTAGVNSFVIPPRSGIALYATVSRVTSRGNHPLTVQTNGLNPNAGARIQFLYAYWWHQTGDVGLNCFGSSDSDRPAIYRAAQWWEVLGQNSYVETTATVVTAFSAAGATTSLAGFVPIGVKQSAATSTDTVFFNP